MPTSRRYVEWLGAPVDRATPEWKSFVRSYNLEEWGEPAAFIARHNAPVGPDQYRPKQTWFEIYLATDPPRGLFHSYGERLDPSTRWPAGPWQAIPLPGEASAEEASAWAREHVGVAGAAPSADRGPLNFEVHGFAPYQLRPGHLSDAYAAAPPARFGVKLQTLTDLSLDHERLAIWLESARRQFLLPLIEGNSGHGVLYDSRTYDAHFNVIHSPPYGISVSCSGTSVSDRIFIRDGDERGWIAMIKRLRRQELLELGMSIYLLDGDGGLSSSSADLKVELRSDFVPPGEQWQSHLPTSFAVHVSDSLIRFRGAEAVTAALPRLATEAIETFSVYCGAITENLGGTAALSRPDLESDEAANLKELQSDPASPPRSPWRHFRRQVVSGKIVGGPG